MGLTVSSANPKVSNRGILRGLNALRQALMGSDFGSLWKGQRDFWNAIKKKIRSNNGK
jgi:hypothetical protein